MKRLLTAKFWRYTGSDPNGKNCELNNPHKIKLEVICYLAYWKNLDILPYPLTERDMREVKVVHHRRYPKNPFGYPVTVEAPKEVWQKAVTAYEVRH